MEDISTAELLRKDIELAYCGNVNLREVTISQLQNAFSSQQITAEQLTNSYLKRIEALNPYLNAVIEVNPDALNIAKELDEERNKSGPRGPLHGIPILVKDNIGTNDKMETCAGSLALIGLKPKKDSEIATRLRKSGAIILGKANLSEFANFRDPDIPDGWSGRGKQTRNAYILSENPLGSSSGSAVAVAANLAVASLGSETDGSLIAPASSASVIGLKPTVGSVSNAGVVPLAGCQDSVGPMARTVSDAALIYNAIAKKPLETKCFDILHPDILCCMETTFKVGVLRNPFWVNVDEKVAVKIERVLEAIGFTGIIVFDPVQAEEGSLEKVSNEDEQQILDFEFKSGINDYLAFEVQAVEDELGNRSNIKTLADIIQHNKDHPTPEKYGQKFLEEADATEGTDDPSYLMKRDDNISAAREAIDYILNLYELDAIVAPSISGGAHLSAVAGYPIISVPAGFTSNGLPFGISFIGTANSEEKLLLIAYRFENAYKTRHTSLFKK